MMLNVRNTLQSLIEKNETPTLTICPYSYVKCKNLKRTCEKFSLECQNFSLSQEIF